MQHSACKSSTQLVNPALSLSPVTVCTLLCVWCSELHTVFKFPMLVCLICLFVYLCLLVYLFACTCLCTGHMYFVAQCPLMSTLVTCSFLFMFVYSSQSASQPSTSSSCQRQPGANGEEYMDHPLCYICTYVTIMYVHT